MSQEREVLDKALGHLHEIGLRVHPSAWNDQLVLTLQATLDYTSRLEHRIDQLAKRLDEQDARIDTVSEGGVEAVKAIWDAMAEDRR